MHSVAQRVRRTVRERELAGPDAPVLLMVSGGSDSVALAYAAHELREAGVLGPLAMLHVNHRLRAADADDDARFVAHLAETLDIPLFNCEVDVGALTRAEGGNVEAVARRERYAAAELALRSHCQHGGAPFHQGRLFTGHTADDRVETFYMRSIVGTGPGGFRSMRYLNGLRARPLLDLTRQQLRAYVEARAGVGLPCVRDQHGALWREDATNSETDYFRAFVRHRMVPLARERNPRVADTLGRTMNLIADEDDYMNGQVNRLWEQCVRWLDSGGRGEVDHGAGFVLDPRVGGVHVALRRRVAMRALGLMLGSDARVEAASVEAVLAGFADKGVNSGYVTNIQGNLAVSANLHGVRVEPMAAFRARRKRDARD
ncbi:tRNA lysidine(34) synthetase TilS [Eggerthellaceae bacterium zg-1084]|uniref:tRNA lysidine(34) synthetase TilS n=1 Tax=Berryella wangjianweii TaxID=2734634 RepID=UPI001557B61B|nr:tRNA lysidine(34) synthetase TilS [Berryella wangjianweii]NPD31524.1 tRNA lysidine(34) synthetase TilS [Berryella wangjianweii]NPD32981.1 tRNA lysidine(34) synthetase TilS [Eggerthellaceae bacterium zg-997]